MPEVCEQIIASNPHVYKHMLDINKTSSAVSEAQSGNKQNFKFFSELFLVCLTLVLIAIFFMVTYSQQNYLPPNLSCVNRNLEDFRSPTTIYVLSL